MSWRWVNGVWIWQKDVLYRSRLTSSCNVPLIIAQWAEDSICPRKAAWTPLEPWKSTQQRLLKVRSLCKQNVVSNVREPLIHICCIQSPSHHGCKITKNQKKKIIKFFEGLFLEILLNLEILLRAIKIDTELVYRTPERRYSIENSLFLKI